MRRVTGSLCLVLFEELKADLEAEVWVPKDTDASQSHATCQVTGRREEGTKGSRKLASDPPRFVLKVGPLKRLLPWWASL